MNQHRRYKVFGGSDSGQYFKHSDENDEFFWRFYEASVTDDWSASDLNIKACKDIEIDGMFGDKCWTVLKHTDDKVTYRIKNGMYMIDTTRTVEICGNCLFSFSLNYPVADVRIDLTHGLFCVASDSGKLLSPTNLGPIAIYDGADAPADRVDWNKDMKYNTGSWLKVCLIVRDGHMWRLPNYAVDACIIGRRFGETIGGVRVIFDVDGWYMRNILKEYKVSAGSRIKFLEDGRVMKVEHRGKKVQEIK